MFIVDISFSLLKPRIVIAETELYHIAKITLSWQESVICFYAFRQWLSNQTRVVYAYTVDKTFLLKKDYTLAW